MEIPVDVAHLINDWVYEFYRIESIHRVRIFQNNWSSVWNIVCEDIRLNTPRYSLLFPDGKDVVMFSIFSPDCNPQEITHFQDRLKFVKRRAMSLTEIYRFL
jgi:hypothetical protein